MSDGRMPSVIHEHASIKGAAMLNALIPQPEDADNEGFFALHSIRKTQSGMSLELVFDPSNGSQKQKWEVDCTGVREFFFRDAGFANLYVETEHPILLIFNELHVELYFYSVPSNISALIGELSICHEELTGEWVSFTRFFNRRPGGLHKLLSLRSGMLAKGPQTIIQRYASILTSHGVNHSLRSTGLPPIWNGEKWQQPASKAKVLLLNGSYIVADRFDPRQLIA